MIRVENKQQRSEHMVQKEWMNVGCYYRHLEGTIARNQRIRGCIFKLLRAISHIICLHNVQVSVCWGSGGVH